MPYNSGRNPDKRVKEVSIKMIFRLGLENRYSYPNTWRRKNLNSGTEACENLDQWRAGNGWIVETQTAGAPWRREFNELVILRGFLALNG